MKDSNCTCPVYVPTAFSPDNNMLNDLFQAQASCPAEAFTLRVFNRWGELVFQSTSPDKGWDGSFNGAPCPEGLYMWTMSYSGRGNLHYQHGSVLLMR